VRTGRGVSLSRDSVCLPGTPCAPVQSYCSALLCVLRAMLCGWSQRSASARPQKRPAPHAQLAAVVCKPSHKLRGGPPSTRPKREQLRIKREVGLGACSTNCGDPPSLVCHSVLMASQSPARLACASTRAQGIDSGAANPRPTFTRSRRWLSGCSSIFLSSWSMRLLSSDAMAPAVHRSGTLTRRQKPG